MKPWTNVNFNGFSMIFMHLYFNLYFSMETHAKGQNSKLNFYHKTIENSFQMKIFFDENMKTM